MKFRFLFLGLLSLMAVSCSFNEIALPEDNSVYSGYEKFYAIIDEQPDADTKVFADESLRVRWNADDRITIFNKSTYNQQFLFTGGDGDNAGGFEPVPADGSVVGDELDRIYAVYPYQESTKISGDGIITTSIPAEQVFKKGSFGIGANTMVSATDDNKLRFKNLGGYLSFKFYGEDVSVSSITLKTNNGELIAGDCTVDMSGGLPETSLVTDESADAVTLTCEPAIVLPTEKENAVMAIFVLYPGTMTDGFTITVNTSDGRVFEKSLNRKMVIGRSAITRMAALEVVPKPKEIVYTKASSITVGGTYLILDQEEKRLFTGATDGSFVDVSPQDNAIIDTDGSMAGYEFTVENDGNNYYLKFNDGGYLVNSYSGSNAGLAYVDSQADVTYPYALSTGDNGAFFFSTTQVNKPSEINQVLYYKVDNSFFKIGGSGRTIGVRLYMKDGKPDRGLSFDPKSVTCTLGEDLEEPILYGTYTTVTYSSSDDSIATVDDEGNVTTVATGIVTITATAEEDSEFSAGSATYTLRILNAPIEGWRDLGTVSLENDALRDYLDAAIWSYSDTDEATNTVMDRYASGSAYSYIDRKDCPKPVTIPWTNAASNSTVVTIYEDQDLHHSICSQNAKEGATAADVYNLIPGCTYYYTISEDEMIWEKGYFVTTGRRRMIKVSDIERTGHANNCRDLGGLEVVDNGTRTTIKYGYIFRGTNMDKTTETEKDILTGFLNVGMDIDLRKGTTSGTLGDNGSQNCYQPFTDPKYKVGYINPGFNSFNDLKDNDKIKSVITAIFETAKSGKASYFHCYIGADRTGYIAMLIEGLLGVSEKDCSIDYELTSFSKAAELRYRTGKPNDYYFRLGLDFLRGQDGDTFQKKIENYLVNTVKISQDDIDKFKKTVLVGTSGIPDSE